MNEKANTLHFRLLLLAILVNYSVRLLVDIWLELAIALAIALGFYIAITFIKHRQDWR